jgi:ComF family protein
VTATKVYDVLKARMRVVRSLFWGLNHLLWPALCVNCKAAILESEKDLCRNCWSEIMRCSGGDYCRRCGKDASIYAAVDNGCAACHQSEIHFDAIARSGVYDGALRNMILAFKYNDRTEFDRLLCMLADSALTGSGFPGEIDFFVPVPLHWRRRLWRGYNQSLFICKGLSGLSGRVNTDLVRIRHTKRQWNLTPADRKRNVSGAFAVRKGHKFSGQTLCLVDDITTSGATLNECAKTLKEAGAKSVYAVVVTVAMQNVDG